MKPESFGRFLLLERIATGGMAEVHLAKVPGPDGLDKFFALKRILPQHMVETEFVEMFKSEAKIALNLTQSNIAQIFEFGEVNGQFYLLMEYIEGRDLRQILNRCAELKDGFTVEQSVYMISEVLKGLDYAHRCIDKRTGKPLRIIHRDMSPHNVMISFDGEVKIIDFGIAKAESRLAKTRAGTVKGKLSYMSPEHASGGDIDNRADLFSIGIVFWELLTGRRLFDADDDMVILQKIRECRIQDIRLFNPRYPEELQRIAAKALTKDTKYRYQAASEFHRDLVAFLHKMNPQFTQYEMAAPVRRVFAKEIEDARNKNLEYSRVNLESIAADAAASAEIPTVSKTVDLSKPVEVTDSVSRTNTDFMSSSSQATQGSVLLPPDAPAVPKIVVARPPVKSKTDTFVFGEKTDTSPKVITPKQPAMVATPTAAPAPSTTPTPTPGKSPPPGISQQVVVQGAEASQSHDFDVKKLLDPIQRGAAPKVKSVLTTPDNSVIEDENIVMPDSGKRKDVVIMIICAAAFIIVSLGIYFRHSLDGVKEKVRTSAVIAAVQDKLGIKRDLASVTLHEGDSAPTSSSKTATLQNATIMVQSNPAGSEILLNGHSHGASPSQLLLPLRTHVTITIQHEGYASFTEEFTVSGPREFNVVLQKNEEK